LPKGILKNPEQEISPKTAISYLSIQMRHFKTILLLLLLIGASVYTLTPFLHQVRIATIRMQAREKLRKSLLQTIHIKETEVKWTEAGKEILINGRLFDVEEFRTEKDLLTITGLFDDEETKCQNQLEAMCNSRSNREKEVLLKHFQLPPYTCYHQNSFQFNSSASIDKIFPGENVSKREEIFIKIPSPPPQA
jgi:hypothetical protein